MARPPIPPAPHKPAQRKPPAIPEAKDLPRPPEHLPPRSEPVPASSRGPPLFIKIDKYREVVDSLHKLKTYALGLRDALEALNDVEKELQHGLSITHRALEKFSSTIAEIDAKMTRSSPGDAERSEPASEMNEYVSDLHEQMQRIKKDLGSISF